jgi:citronellol/citronellal dehydrogenase
MTGLLDGRSAIVTGAGRGIGRAIAESLAAAGASVIVADVGASIGGDDADPAPAREVAEAIGKKAIAFTESVASPGVAKQLVEIAVKNFGGIDIVVNNASAIQTTPVSQTDMKRYDLMHGINARGTFMVSKYAILHLQKAANPHILMISPPLDMQPKWFAPYTAYAMAKFNMSIIALGLSGELRGKIAVNTLWPRTTIATAAIKNLLGGDIVMQRSRKPEIIADAAYALFQKPVSFSGNFLIDDTFLAGEGVTDFEKYRVDPSQPLQVDIFMPDSPPPPNGVTVGGRL